ncbi:MAG TPA: hypothetical protein VH253_17450 [Phycisphaerae bacterium]|nr:hypothetical protein [Phycisphaerae bacterium]
MAKRRKFDNTIRKQYEQLTPDQVAQRWRAMRPRYVKWTCGFLLGAVALFLGNRALPLNQGTVNVINVAFQIFCIFAVMFTVLLGMSFIFGGRERASSAH